MPQYKITYFNVRGRAEVMRQILHHAGQDFEDVRVDGTTEWPNIKPTTPFGQIPLLEVDGKVICQSNAGARYLAKVFGLYGSNDWEAAEIDMIVDSGEDMVRPWRDIFMEKDPEKKEAVKKKYEEEQLPNFLNSFEKILNKRDYFVGDKLSLADIHFINYFSTTADRFNLNKDSYPGLFALRERVENFPNIKAWIARRPKSDI